MPKRNVVSYITMIDGYAKARDMASARFLFEQVPQRDIFVWSALILSVNFQSVTIHIKPVLFYVYAKILTCQVYAREKRR